MAKPVIVSVDDDPEVLAAIERDLRAHFKSAYRIIKANSASEGLEVARELNKRGVPVAMFLVDQRMPEMSGTELLREARKLHPDARKVLLTAYADTDAAIDSINDIGLDHYLLKPWSPPEEKLYPVLDDLLLDWQANVRLPYDGIRLIGARWSPESFAAKDLLTRNQVPYQWIDLEQTPSARATLASLDVSETQLPVVLFPDGRALISPNKATLAEECGIRSHPARRFYDMIVIGAGPAGLAASVYGASEGIRTLLVEQSGAGGQAGTSSRIENYLGFPSGVSGADLAHRAVTQAKRFGAELLEAQEVTGVRCEDPYRIIRLADGSEVACHALVLAMGVAVRRLEVSGAEHLTGIGVYYGAAMTEAATYRNKDILIVGAGNSAGQGALFFSRTAASVTIVLRRDSLGRSMSQYLVDRIDAAENIRVMPNVQVAEVVGENCLDRVTLRDVRDGAESRLDVSAMFVFIGAAPHTDLVADLVERDDKGFVLTGPHLIRDGKRPKGWKLDRDPMLFETSVPGIFAAGDVRSGSSKRVAAAVGEGSGTVSNVHAYRETV